MPLDDLIEVIASLQERLNQFSIELKENETRTRMSLVDPLLTALSWNTADPILVTAEYSVGEGRADYALLGPDGKPVACIEAKKLGEPLEKHRMQMINYCNVGGIQFAGLTDGNQWELYEVFSLEPKPLDDRCRLNVSISDCTPTECALTLLLLWRPNLASGQPATANIPIVGMQSIPAPDPPPNPSEEKPEPPWVSLSEYDPPSKTPPPSEIRLPNGNVHKIAKWYDILLQVVHWLWSSGKLTEKQVPINSSAKRYLINTTPVHPNGIPFRAPVPIPDAPLTLEAHRSASATRSAAVKLLNSLGAEIAAVCVRPSSKSTS